MEPFRYFADPAHFSHLADAGTPCDFCAETALTFDGSGYYGTRDVGAICARCLRTGKLAEIDVSTNEVAVSDLPSLLGSEKRAREVVREIECCTPALPTWQDREWPFLNGEFPRFIKIASRVDFVDKVDLYDSVPEAERLGHDADALWDMLPDGSYEQRRPGRGRRGKSAQERFIEAAERDYKEATRLRKRKPKGISRRNVR